jgi:hypothetical protein
MKNIFLKTFGWIFYFVIPVGCAIKGIFELEFDCLVSIKSEFMTTTSGMELIRIMDFPGNAINEMK